MKRMVSLALAMLLVLSMFALGAAAEEKKLKIGFSESALTGAWRDSEVAAFPKAARVRVQLVVTRGLDM